MKNAGNNFVFIRAFNQIKNILKSRRVGMNLNIRTSHIVSLGEGACG